MRKCFSLFFIIALIISCSLISCYIDNRPTITIYSPHGVDLLEAFRTRFEAANPGIAVRYLDLSSQDLYTRIKLERENVQADIWWGAAANTFDKAANDGLLEPYKPSWADKIEPFAHDSQDRWYGTYQTPEVIVYNKALLKPEEAPKEWDEVLDAKWKGKLLIRDPLRSDTMRAIFGALIMREWEQQNGPQGGYEWLKRLDANTKEYTTDGTLLVQKLARQEGQVSLWDLPDVAIAIYKNNLPLDFHVPASGTPVVVDGIAIVKNTKNLELAKKFYEFATNEESLVIAAKDFYHLPLRKDVDRTKLPEWFAKLEIKPMPFDQAKFKSGIQEWMLYWDSKIRNQNH